LSLSLEGAMMQGKLQVYHHLGLGDHIICNGLVRRLCTSHDKVYCFVKRRYASSVSFMYRDEPKIQLIPVEADWEVPLRTNKRIRLIKIGFEKLDRASSNFDEDFYRQLGFDFSIRWNNFYIERDYEIECELFRKLNPSKKPYVFVHDDPSRGLVADLSLIRKDLKMIRASDYSGNNQFQKYTLFHWILTLQKSEEIHCMDSSFKCLVESLSILEDKKLFFHRYIKGRHEICSTRKRWTVVKSPSLFFQAHRLACWIRRKVRNR
jgi:hypothetical protein